MRADPHMVATVLAYVGVLLQLAVKNHLIAGLLDIKVATVRFSAVRNFLTTWLIISGVTFSSSWAKLKPYFQFPNIAVE